ncbi:unnamed protein product [Penicillium glandicola]
MRFQGVRLYNHGSAIHHDPVGLRFKSTCKVALLFPERFWEKGDRPIFGCYSKPSSDSVGVLYFPVYGLNESRPGLIMHYRGGNWSDRFVGFSERPGGAGFDWIMGVSAGSKMNILRLLGVDRTLHSMNYTFRLIIRQSITPFSLESTLLNAGLD